MERLRAKSMWEWDEDFPNDEDEIYFYVGQGPEVSNLRKVTESTTAMIEDKEPNKEMMQELLKEGGTLGAGALPSIGKVNEDGEKNIHEALSGAEIAKVKKTTRKAKKEEEAVVMGDKSPKEVSAERLPEILKASGDARKYAVALKHLSYVEKLVSELMAFSAKMEGLYECIVKLNEHKSEDMSAYAELLETSDQELAWYKSTEVR